MRVNVKSNAGLSLIFFFFTYATLLFGQQDVAGDRREKALERIEMMRMWRMTEYLDLTEQEGAVLFPLLRELDEERKSLDTENRKVMQELRDTTRGENPDREVVRHLLERFRNVREKKSSLEEKEYERVSDILSPEGVARYVIFKRDFDRESKPPSR